MLRRQSVTVMRGIFVLLQLPRGRTEGVAAVLLRLTLEKGRQSLSASLSLSSKS